MSLLAPLRWERDTDEAEPRLRANGARTQAALWPLLDAAGAQRAGATMAL
ncbi:MAG: hypothetical protein OXM87_06245 [Truepera sp.]|nr:hypothetical protein [Truepera sp.]